MPTRLVPLTACRLTLAFWRVFPYHHFDCYHLLMVRSTSSETCYKLSYRKLSDNGRRAASLVATDQIPQYASKTEYSQRIWRALRTAFDLVGKSFTAVLCNLNFSHTNRIALLWKKQASFISTGECRYMFRGA